MIFLYKRLIKVISEKNIVFVIPKNKKNEELYTFFKKEKKFYVLEVAKTMF